MQSALEQTFPHIVDHLLEAWPKGSEAMRYLDELLFTGGQRPDRHGFNEDVWMELTFLNDLLHEECPTAPSELATDIWGIAFESGSERFTPSAA
jgi:hypothetical protein